MSDDFSADIHTTGVLTLNTPLSGRIDSASDQDWVAMTLEAGKSYGIAARGSSSFAPVIPGLFDASGTSVGPVASNGVDQVGFRPPVNRFDGVHFTPATTGTYFVSVAAAEAGEYELTLFEDAVPGDVSSTERVEVDQPLMGSLDGSLDQDWYRVSLQAQNSFYVEVLGNGHGSNTLPTPGLFFFNGSGDFLRQGSIGGAPVPGSNGEIYGASSTHHFSPEQDGEYFVAVADTKQNGPGSYTLIVNTVESERPDIPDSLAKAVEMSVAETRFARLDNDLDTDWYRIALEAGQLYHVEMQQNVFATDPYGEESRLRIDDLSGNVLATGLPFGPDNESAGLTFRPETDGEYVAIASHDSAILSYYSLTARALPSLQSTDGDDQLSLPGDVAVQLLDIDGGVGRDTMSFAGYEGGVVLNLANGYVRGDAPGDRFALLMDGIEAASGTSQDDRLFGSDGNDALRGLGGRDRMFGSDGRDLIHGGAGRDLLSYGLSEDGVSVSLLRGRGWSGDAAGDRIRTVENLAGSNQDDFLWGDHRANVLIGGAGDDVLTGNGGNDYLFGGAGTDIAVFAGNRADYAIAQSGDYHQITGPGGDQDQVAGVEILRFADGDLLL